MDTLVAFVVAVLVIGFFMRSYLKRQKKNEEEARAAAEKGKLYSSGPQSQHPHIDANYCIGCAAFRTSDYCILRPLYLVMKQLNIF